MASSFTTNKTLELPGNGDYVDTWNVPVNADMTIIDAAFGGVQNLNATSGNATLSNSAYQNLALNVTGAMSASTTYTIPSGVGGFWIVRNATTDSTGGPWNVNIASGGGGSSVTVIRGRTTMVWSDGTNIRDVNENIPSIGTVTSVDVSGGTTGLTTSGGPITTNGTITIAGTLAITNGGTGRTTFGTGVQTALGANVTGSGGIVLATGGTLTSPILTTPNIGTPSFAVLTNATDLPVSTGISGLGANVATFLATPSSTNLRNAVTDETGTGSLVFATSPVLTTPNIGVPSFATLTNATGLPLTTGVTGTLPVANGGTGVTTSTGSGNNVLSTSPVLTTPNLGTPSAAVLTNATGLPLTTGVTGTLPVANGGTGVTTSTGSGSNVLSTSPVLTTPNLGTPSAVTLTNATGLPIGAGTTGTLAVDRGGTGSVSLATNNVLLGNGTAALQAVAPGASGNVLTSDGTTWQSSALPSFTSSGRLLRAPQILTSGTSYTTPADCTAIYVEMVGGGQGGAARNFLYSGGAGGYAAKYFTVSPNTAYAYAIGAGGAGKTGSGNGNAGGNTTFTVGATTVTANGGSGAGLGGTATNGDLNITGGYGAILITFLADTGIANYVFGAGGSSMFGQGARSNFSTSSVSAEPALGYGAGGGGNISGTSAAGTGGLIRIWEFS